jgi:hypothetical protein
VAWDEPEGAATTVGSYRVTFDDDNDVHEASVPRYGLLNGLRVQDGTSEYSPQLKQTNADESDYNKDIQITVYAVNEAGELVIKYIPAGETITADGDAVLLPYWYWEKVFDYIIDTQAAQSMTDRKTAQE